MKTAPTNAQTTSNRVLDIRVSCLTGLVLVALRVLSSLTEAAGLGKNGRDLGNAGPTNQGSAARCCFWRWVGCSLSFRWHASPEDQCRPLRPGQPSQFLASS